MTTHAQQSPLLETADSRAVIEHALRGVPLDPAVEKRVRERTARIRDQIRSRGLTDIAVELIRDARDL